MTNFLYMRGNPAIVLSATQSAFRQTPLTMRGRLPLRYAVTVRRASFSGSPTLSKINERTVTKCNIG
jgi:hypothetical protein